MTFRLPRGTPHGPRVEGRLRKRAREWRRHLAPFDGNKGHVDSNPSSTTVPAVCTDSVVCEVVVGQRPAGDRVVSGDGVTVQHETVRGVALGSRRGDEGQGERQRCERQHDPAPTVNESGGHDHSCFSVRQYIN